MKEKHLSGRSPLYRSISFISYMMQQIFRYFFNYYNYVTQIYVKQVRKPIIYINISFAKRKSAQSIRPARFRLLLLGFSKNLLVTPAHERIGRKADYNRGNSADHHVVTGTFAERTCDKRHNISAQENARAFKSLKEAHRSCQILSLQTETKICLQRRDGYHDPKLAADSRYVAARYSWDDRRQECANAAQQQCQRQRPALKCFHPK